MFKLFRKETHLFDEWVKTTDGIALFVPDKGSIDSLHLGERIELISQIGKPESYNQVGKNHYTLEYPNLTLECEDGLLTYIGCTFGDITVKTTENRVIERAMDIDQIMDLLGAPDQEDTGDLEDIVLNYAINGMQIEFEFGGSQELIRVNCFRKVHT